MNRREFVKLSAVSAIPTVIQIEPLDATTQNRTSNWGYQGRVIEFWFQTNALLHTDVWKTTFVKNVKQTKGSYKGVIRGLYHDEYVCTFNLKEVELGVYKYCFGKEELEKGNYRFMTFAQIYQSGKRIGDRLVGFNYVTL
jgi:hypothetical protein